MDGALRRLDKLEREISRSVSMYNDFASQLASSTFASTQLTDFLATCDEPLRRALASVPSIQASVSVANFATSNLQQLSRVNDTLAKFVSTAAFENSALSRLLADQNRMMASLASIVPQSSVIKLLSSLDATKLFDTSLSSQLRLFALESSSFGQLINASKNLGKALTDRFSDLTRSYCGVIECFPTVSPRSVPIIAKFAPMEYSLEVNILERISVVGREVSDGETLPSIDDELRSFDDKLLRLVNGARESLKGSNPDRVRHVMVSVRELFTHILHALAPDPEIREWSSDSEHYHETRPTRRARLLYICRKFSCDPLSKFVEADVRSALALIDAVNAGTHVVQSKLTGPQLAAIVHRMESLVLFLLKVSREDGVG